LASNSGGDSESDRKFAVRVGAESKGHSAGSRA
jgi:hypothetical protein